MTADRIVIAGAGVAAHGAVSGLRNKTEVWCHTCWGNPAQQRLYPTNQSYASALPLLNKLDVDVMTFETCANDGLDLEAMKAARQWRFRPGTRMGEPVSVLVIIQLDFTLR